jgi:hypothetical protein
VADAAGTEATFQRIHGMVPEPGSPRGAFLVDAVDTATSRHLYSLRIRADSVFIQEVRWTLRAGWQVVNDAATLDLDPPPAELLEDQQTIRFTNGPIAGWMFRPKDWTPEHVTVITSVTGTRPVYRPAL